MNEKKELSEQELALSIQILQEQAKALASNVETLTIYLHELSISKKTLEGLQTCTKGDEILVPIGASSFVKARIEDTENVIAGVGADVSVAKTVEQAIDSLEKRITLMESKIKENQETYVRVAQKLEELGAQAQKLLEEKGEYV
jgi:prefoldin alpha subunit